MKKYLVLFLCIALAACAFFTLNASAANVESIELMSGPTQTLFAEGDNFNSEGITIRVNYDDGTFENKTSGFTCEADLSDSGVAVVTITYEGKTTEAFVRVEMISKIDILSGQESFDQCISRICFM